MKDSRIAWHGCNTSFFYDRRSLRRFVSPAQLKCGVIAGLMRAPSECPFDGTVSHPRMASDPNAPLRAAVLSATLMLEPGPAEPLVLRVAAIRRLVPRIGDRLNLDAAIYRYRIDIEGNVSVRRDAVGARGCRILHRRR